MKITIIKIENGYLLDVNKTGTHYYAKLEKVLDVIALITSDEFKEPK